MDILENIKAFNNFRDGNIHGEYIGGGSYDRYLVYVGEERVADLSVNHRGWPKGSVWTRTITRPERLTSPEAKALAKELQSFYMVNRTPDGTSL